MSEQARAGASPDAACPMIQLAIQAFIKLLFSFGPPKVLMLPPAVAELTGGVFAHNSSPVVHFMVQVAWPDRSVMAS